MALQPHVAFVPFTGLRVGASPLLDLGMSLPGLEPRAKALRQLPALGLLTLAGMTPADWTCSIGEKDIGCPTAIVERPAARHSE